MDKNRSNKWLAILVILSSWVITSVHAQSIPSVPLITSNSAEPNIQMILDDSGSMHWEMMPDDYVIASFTFPRANNIYGLNDYTNFVATVDDNDPYNALTRSPQVNKIYYNPSVTYRPWSKADGSLFSNANPSCADHNPDSPARGCRALNNPESTRAFWVFLNNNNFFYTDSVKTFWPATYFIHNGVNIWNRNNYTKVEIRSSKPNYTGEGRENRTDCVGAGAAPAVCTYTEEMQNFANWYSFYRSRILTARAGIGRAFSNQGGGFRVGFGSINHGSTSVDGVSTRTVIDGVRSFTGTDRDNFFSTLYGHPMPTSGTPLRRALSDVGDYYSRSDSQGPWSTTPGQTGGTDLVCRQSYTILMTDGYWNSAAANGNAANNNDGTAGPTITGPNAQSYTYNAVSPFTDSRNNTLADAAMYYWKRDLRTNISNEVPTNYKDPAFWQHMVTFGVGLGVTGSVNPAVAFAAINTGAAINWADPTATNPAKIDDLLHASVNGRGGFFSAKNPDDFATALSDTLTDISKRIGSASSIAANSTSISTNSQIFQAKFNSANWSGELEAFPVTATGVGSTPTWSASTQISAPASRNIFTTTGGTAAKFKWSNLSVADKAFLANKDTADYLRGNRNKELQNGGTFRNRASTVLGDIVHSSPYYVKDTDTVYVGANDGMLHAFDASTGSEVFGYIPGNLIAKLASYAQPSYAHDYFVDGDIAASTLAQSPGYNYLVASLGRGGKGLFGLDVTNPSTFASSNVLWEYTDTTNPTDTDLGFMLGRPTIAKMNDGSLAVIIANGYNSTSGKAVLYIFDLTTGSLIKKIDTLVAGDNGLSAPGVVDSDNDGDIDYIYAGDLKGNVWKFDVSGSTASSWNIAFSSSPLFVAKDSLGNIQPITAPITTAVDTEPTDPNFGKRFVFFGTGSYFKSGDPVDTQVQSWYGLIDDGTQISGRSSLVLRSILAEGFLSGVPVRTFAAAVTNDMVGKQGWYIDFSTQAGERIVTRSIPVTLAVPTLLASSIIPVNDPCVPGGHGYINAINPFSGARLSRGVIDVDHSGQFTDDTLNGVEVGGFDPGVGMPSEPLIMGDRLIVGGSDGTTKDYVVNLGVTPTKGRISWREIISQ